MMKVEIKKIKGLKRIQVNYKDQSFFIKCSQDGVHLMKKNVENILMAYANEIRINANVENNKLKLSKHIVNNLNSVLDIVSVETGVPIISMINTETYKSRDTEIIDALTVYYKICLFLWPEEDNKTHKITTKKIGALVGRDHSTVIHNSKKVYPEIMELYERIVNQII